MNNIYLTGFMGTGKTSVGELLAQRTGWSFVDLDVRIAERQGMSIADIFARKGESFFRALEKKILKETAGLTEQVVSCGGGIVLDPENRTLMKRTGRIVCLTARPEVILERTRESLHRPLLNVKDPVQKIAELLGERAACYAQADLMVDTSELNIRQVVETIITGGIPK